MSAETAMWKALARAVTCYGFLNTMRSSEAEIKQDSKLFVCFPFFLLFNMFHQVSTIVFGRSPMPDIHWKSISWSHGLTEATERMEAEEHRVGKWPASAALASTEHEELVVFSRFPTVL